MSRMMKRPFPRVPIATHTSPKKAERLQVEILSAKKQVWHNKEKIKEGKADDDTTTSCRCVIPTAPTTRKKTEPQVEILSEQKRKQTVEQRQYIISRMTKNKNNKEVWHNKEKIKEKSKENVEVETKAEITDQSVITTISQKADRLATDEDERTGHDERIKDVFVTLWLGTVDMMDSNVLMNDIRDEWLYFKGAFR